MHEYIYSSILRFEEKQPSGGFYVYFIFHFSIPM